MSCCFDLSEYTGAPDNSPCVTAVDVPALVRELDALNAGGRETEGAALLESARAVACEQGDWRSELSVLSELLGQYRRGTDAGRALAAVDAAMELIRSHGLGRTVSGATVMLNAATTLRCFGRAEQSIPIFRHVCLVYGATLDPSDYRFAALYNNMAGSCAEAGGIEEAERCYLLALDVLRSCPDPGNDEAVTLCSLAELYERRGDEDRANDCMERAWAALNAPGLPRDGYHAFAVSKCVPCFEHFGYFIYSMELKRRVKAIYEGT